MNWLSIVQLAIQWGPTIKGLIDEAVSNDDLVTKIRQTVASPLVTWLEEEAAKLFPKAAPAIHLAGGAIAAFDTNTTKWLQGSLNAILGVNPPLVVDGIYGPKTAAAVEQAQAKLGLKIDGLAGQITQAAISAILARLPNFTPAIQSAGLA